jgi:ABC-2 type transport system permease protein
LTDALGIQWNFGQVSWGRDNPHPNFKGKWSEMMGDQWPEYFGPYDKAFVFVRNVGDHMAFNADSSISSGLKELLLFYPGSVQKAADSNLDFIPLVTLGRESGLTDWDQLTEVPVQRVSRINPRTGRQTVDEEKARSQITGEDLYVLNPAPQAYLDDQVHVIAAHLVGKDPKEKVNAVVIADLDFVSDLYYEQIEELGQNLDNVVLLQNAIEYLAGEKAFVSLRSRRPSPRTLDYVEEKTKRYRVERTKKQQEVEATIRQQMEEEQAKLDEATKKIGEDTSLSFLEKLQQTSQQASAAQTRFERKQIKLDKDLKLEIDRLEAEEQHQIRTTESRVKWFSILSAPLPAFVLGLFVWIKRAANERSQITSNRRAS